MIGVFCVFQTGFLWLSNYCHARLHHFLFSFPLYDDCSLYDQISLKSCLSGYAYLDSMEVNEYTKD